MCRYVPYHTDIRTNQSRLWLLFGCLVIANLLAPPSAFSQYSSDRELLDRLIEQTVADLDPETSAQQIEELVELLETLAANPVNINRDNIDRLSEIPIVDLRLAQSIIAYRRDIKPFETTDELMEVSGIGPATYEQIQPFVTTGSALERTSDLVLNRRYWTSGGSFESLTRYQRVLQNREGYSRPDSLGGYLGAPYALNHRLRYRSNHLSAALSLDKDPGEPLEQPGDFDYASWHISARDAGILNHLVVGDYRVSYGQGLVLWNGGSFGKGSQVTGSAIKNDPGIRPYTSSQETQAFRGIAISAGERLQLSAFYSARKRTASEISDQFVRFPNATGLHRTETERNRRLNLGQETAGGRLRYQFSHGIIGISGYHNRFDREIAQGSQPYQAHQFSGKTHSVAGSDYRILAGPVTFFGEAAWSENHAFAFLSGVETEWASQTEVSVLYRTYATDFQSIFGNAFGEQSSPQNEEGFYAGLYQPIGNYFELNAYVDLFSTRAASFGNNRPTSGVDWLTRLDIEPVPDLSLYLQVRSKTREQEMAVPNEFGRLEAVFGNESRSSARIHLTYQVSQSVRLRSRVDAVRFRTADRKTTHGFLFYQDLRFRYGSTLTVDLRTTLFDTEDFNSRVFQFENDLLYVMSSTMLFQQGQRSYLVVRYDPADWMIIRFKTATTLYENRPVIGSGLDEISGSRRTDIGMQVQIRF